MRIALNTSCAVAGGAVTHLRYLLPELLPRLGPDELTLIGDPASRDRIDPARAASWEIVAPFSTGLSSRLRFENIELPRVLRRLAADVLFHPGNFSAFMSPIPQVNLLHNLAPFLPEVIAGESIGQKIRLRVLRRLTLGSLAVARSTIFISRWGRALVLGDRPIDDRRFPVVPFGADHGAPRRSTEVLERWSLRESRFVLTVSHLYRYKKIENLVDAWVAMGDRVRDVPLVIVGEPFDGEYAQRLVELGRASRGPVVFTGGLPTSDLVTLMSTCRAFVFTSEAENLPITLLEAMAARCAILTNRACSMPEVCGDAAIYADPATSEQYRARLEELLADDAMCDDLRERAARRATAFRWRDAADKTLEILRLAADQRPAS